MTAPKESQPVPISITDDGAWRITSTRVTVDVVLGQFRRGATPEQIQDDFPDLSLAQIYSLISYYLSNTEEVESYLEEREAKAAAIRNQWESDSDVLDFRTKIREARDALAK